MSNLRSRRMLGLILFGIFAVLVSACTPSHPQSTFDTLGPVSRSQANLFYIILGVGIVVFILVEGAIIYAVIRYRRRPNQGDPVQVHGNTKLEIIWTVVPALILIIVAVPTINSVFFSANSPRPAIQGGLEVDVIGHQWWFEFRYENPNNPQEQIVFANELHIPVGEPVNLRLDSVDVIHSFWVPKLAGKVDMIPNNDNSMWLQADEAGEFFGQCAEFCGVSHANMKFKLIAESREDFDAWLAQQAESAPQSADPLAVEGQELFKSAGCQGCHATNSIMKLGDGGKRLRGRVGPNLTHVSSRGYVVGLLKSFDDGTVVVNDALLQQNLKTWLMDPEAVKPANIMARRAAAFTDPDKALSEGQVDALVAYLLTLK
ncbi:MAG: cytochrome c oxidase subunit II [Chloroflexi bacterium]|nr:cytochrome c oxidase subunit II [Chloroflexota bacterium]